MIPVAHVRRKVHSVRMAPENLGGTRLVHLGSMEPSETEAPSVIHFVWVNALAEVLQKISNTISLLITWIIEI